MPGRNVGQRIKAVLDRVDSVSPSVNLVEGFKQLFAYAPKDAEREHARRMEALLLQLDLAEAQLRKDKFPEVLFRRQFGKLREAFRPALMHQPFAHARGNLDEAARLCIDWVGFALPDEGEALDPSEAQMLANQLEELLASPLLADLPSSVRDLLAVHLRAVLEAIAMADIEGAAPLQKAAKAAATDLVIHADEIDACARSASDGQSTFLKRCGSALKHAMEAASLGGKGAEGVEKMLKLATERGPRALELAKDVMNQLTS